MKEDQRITQEHQEEIARLACEQKELEERRTKHLKKNKEEISKMESNIAQLKNMVTQQEAVSVPIVPPPFRHGSQLNRWEPINLPNSLKPCDNILKNMDKLEFIYIFNEQVDPVQYPDYLDVIKRPMCLNDVRSNLYNGVYTNMTQFSKDVRQIWANARAYNPETHKVHEWAKQYSDIFEDLFRRATATTRKKPVKKCPLTAAELTVLQTKIGELPASSMDYVVDFLRREMPKRYEGQDEIQLNLNSLPGPVLLKLQDVVLNEIRLKPKNRAQKRQRIKRQIQTLQKDEPLSLSSLPPPLL